MKYLSRNILELLLLRLKSYGHNKNLLKIFAEPWLLLGYQNNLRFFGLNE